MPSPARTRRAAALALLAVPLALGAAPAHADPRGDVADGAFYVYYTGCYNTLYTVQCDHAYDDEVVAAIAVVRG
jgi:hypothetical protein